MLPICKSSSFVLLANDGFPALSLPCNRGAVLGTVFERGSRGPVSPDRIADIAAAYGKTFISKYWGGYLAFVTDPPQTDLLVVRDPTGTIPCYVVELNGVTAYFSDVEIALAVRLFRPKIDWRQVAHQLVFDSLRTEQTCLEGVQELMPGTSVSHKSGSRTVHSVWTPWPFAAPEQQLGCRDEAITRLREGTMDCVASWSSMASKILLELSGGLDSSIVAACLAPGSSEVICATLVTPDPNADESRYARRVADHIGAQHEILPLSVENADIAHLPQQRFPRPSWRVLQRLADSAFAKAGRAHDTQAFFAGSGGDNIFGYYGTSAPAADLLRAQGPGRSFFRTLDDLAALHQTSAWSAGKLAIRKSLRRNTPVWKRSEDFLSKDVIFDKPDFHPWLEPPEGVWPGKLETVISLVISHDGIEGKDRSHVAPVRQPLLSQPLVELSLRTPSWMCVSGGRNRAVARDAFANLLPPDIIGRTTKGDFRSFNAMIFEHNRAALKDMLLDGVLASKGLFNVSLIEDYLSSPIPPRDISFSRLLRLACAEAWAQQWTAT
nr:asparagine synthase [Aquisalinus luteolus]